MEITPNDYNILDTGEVDLTHGRPSLQSVLVVDPAKPDSGPLAT